MPARIVARMGGSRAIQPFHLRVEYWHTVSVSSASGGTGAGPHHRRTRQPPRSDPTPSLDGNALQNWGVTFDTVIP